MKRLGKSRRGTVILTQMIQTRVTKEDAAAIDALTEKLDMSIAELLRLLIRSLAKGEIVVTGATAATARSATPAEGR